MFHLFQYQRNLLLIILTVCAVNIAGCAAGYRTFKTDAATPAALPEKLTNIRISYSSSGGKLRNDLALSVERTLRGRFNVMDIQNASRPGGSPSSDRFALIVDERRENSLGDNIWFVGHLLSLATIPAYINTDKYLTLTIVAPDGNKRTFQYRYSERLWSWLPFMFFGPGYVAVFDTETDDYQQKRIEMADIIVTRFMVDVTPFIRDHWASIKGVAK